MGMHKANFFEKILWKLHIKKPNNILTDEERSLALQVRQSRAQTRLLKEQALQAKYMKEIRNIEKPGMEEIFIGMLAGQDVKALLTQAQRPAQHPTGAQILEEISEEEINQYLSKVPADILKRAKAMNDQDLKSFINSNVQMSPQNVAKCIEVIRKK